MYSRIYDYNLPREMISQNLTKPRDMCRLMVVDKKGIKHFRFRDLPEVLKENSVVILNKSRVIPALLELKKPTGGRVNALIWDIGREGMPKAFLKGKIREGSQAVTGDVTLTAVEHIKEGLYKVSIKRDGVELMGEELFNMLKDKGKTPLPPYIKNRNLLDGDYQTVYAEKEGSVAAPTAGLHFTKELLNTLRHNGIDTYFLNLDVGPGTFLPIKSRMIKDHKMESEWFKIEEKDFSSINRALMEGRPIVPIGTTTVRALESASRGGMVEKREGGATVFVTPTYKFQLPYDTFITNFHLPCSTPLLMLSKFIGWEKVFNAYMEAFARGYRFYSLGDAMAVVLR